MSLYNALFGMNPLTPILKNILELDTKPDSIPWPKNEKGENWDPYNDGEEPGKPYIEECLNKGVYPSGRFRDIYYDKENKKIVLYTRNGGGNRDSYFYVFEILKHHPNYITDYDDDFDSTYATIEFSVPEKFKDFLNDLVLDTSKVETVQEKFQRITKEISTKSEKELEADPRFKELFKIMKSLNKTLKKSLPQKDDKKPEGNTPTL